MFESLVAGLIQAGEHAIRFLENRSLQRYLFVFISATLVLGAFPFAVSKTPLLGSLPISPLDPVTLVMGLILMISAVATVKTHRNRILAIIMLSTVGLVVALAFTRFSAPDLALTQISVEVVAIILLMMALHLLPFTTPKESSKPGNAGTAFCRYWPAAVQPSWPWPFLPVPMTPFPIFFWQKVSPAAAAPMWSTLSWWISGDLTPWGRSRYWSSPV